MKIERVSQLAVFYTGHERIRVGRLALRSRTILFEYDPEFIATQLELSPIHLPLAPGVRTGAAALEGLMGVFDDSLPDGWGRRLIDRRAAQLGLTSLSPLDRLALVGARGMGALAYEPETQIDDPRIMKLAELAREAETVLRNVDGADLERLIAAGGSPQGARPKVLVQIGPNGEIHYGARNIELGFTGWMVKFRAQTDHPHSATLERAYFLMAQAAGVAVPSTQLLGRTRTRPGYFAIERFDRVGSARIHCHTLGGLLQLPHASPALDYLQLLKVTRGLTRSEASVSEMFRRACFNVFAHNRDDHSRNFAFLMDHKSVWRSSPAYDLTFAPGPGGEHTMLVDGEGRSPDRKHLVALARKAGVKHATRILEEVHDAVRKWKRFAEAAEVPAALRKQVAKVLLR
jgi:serine/threonine-protein kinase HipA